MTAYAADNASVNYGVRQSVFTDLLSKKASIVKTNCNCHAVHNTLKKLVDVLNCDIEILDGCNSYLWPF